MKNSHKSVSPIISSHRFLAQALLKGTRRLLSPYVRFQKELVMKPLTDHFSLTRKTISLFLLVAFAMTNVVSVSILAAGTSNDPARTTFTTDLTQLGREGRLRKTTNFEKETNQV